MKHAPLLLVLAAMNLYAADFVTLDGQPAAAGNPVDADTLIHRFEKPVMRLMRTPAAAPQGTILLLPGGGYHILAAIHEGSQTAEFLNEQGFDVAILEYHIAAGPQTRDLALADAVAAWRLVKADPAALGLHGGRFGIMGYSAGGHLAARTTQALGDAEQPDEVILIYPAYLHEPRPGTVIPAVTPPAQPKGRLFALIAGNDNKDWVRSCSEYAKTWKGYDGAAVLHVLPDGGHGFGLRAQRTGAAQGWPDLLKAFLANPPQPPAGPNPAAAPVPQRGMEKRHADKVAAARAKKYDVLLVGDSITHNLETPAFQAVWKQYFEPRNALNLGYSGARTENILWNLLNGELDGQSPRVVTLMIGTNNIDEKNYPTRHTAGQLAGGIEAIVRLLREQLPDTKIVLIRTFPGCYGGPNPTSHRAILDRACEIASRVADGKHVVYCDVNPLFLNPDGSLKKELMPDWLHPNPEGARLWAEALAPLLD